jgi:hypothetical protein
MATKPTVVISTVPPNPPVIFLHYDYMAARSWEPSSGNFAPDPDAIDRVVEAFRRHGITLVIDPKHTEIPYMGWLFLGPATGVFGGPPCGPPICANFYDLREQYFHPHGNQPWHYVIFGDSGYNRSTGPEAGEAELPGYNFMVTNQHFASRTCFVGQLDLCKERGAALFMHELGHNLDLRHGGDDDQNYKINYVSVMNYWYPNGIYSTAPGDTYQFGTWFLTPPLSEVEHIARVRVDYSSDASVTLDEHHLDETIGLGGPATSNDVIFYYSCAASLLLPCKSGFIRVAAAPFDWDNDGAIDNDVAVDINYDGNPSGDLLLTEMRGFDDWTHVQQFLRTPQYVSGTLRPSGTIADP